MINDAKLVREKHNDSTNNIAEWNVKDITKLLKTYRVKSDGKLPTKKQEVVDLFHKWKDRPTTKYNGRVTLVDMVDESNVIVTTSTAGAMDPKQAAQTQQQTEPEGEVTLLVK